MANRRVVVTGVGVVSCLGSEADTFYEKLLAGQSGIRPIRSFPVEDYSTRFAGTVEDFDAGPYLDKKQARRVDPFISYGVVAAKKALEYAGFQLGDLASLAPEKCGIVIGSGMGGMQFFSDQVITLHEKGCKRVSPFFVPFTITNMAGGLLAMDLGFMGPNYSISTACATGSHCIVAAAHHIRRGEADLMLCGGTEAAITPTGLAGFCACKALSQRNDAPEKACRPWDKHRDGFVMGDGAGVLVLESLEHAQKRGARILAEYKGGYVNCDAHHFTEPRADGRGIAQCVTGALKDAQVDPEAVTYLNAHATSTPAGDMAEIHALKQVFRDPSKVTLNATKSMVGHCLGAAGGIEAVVSVLALATGKVHPTLNLEDPEEGLAPFHVPTQAEEIRPKMVVSNSYGFGGHNAALVFESR